MPGGDRTGPMGYGPMTGRVGGYCAGYNLPGFANILPYRRFGWGMGRGGGLGRRNRFSATGLSGWQLAPYNYPTYRKGVSRKDELDELKYQADYLEESLEGVKKRMAELEKESVE